MQKFSKKQYDENPKFPKVAKIIKHHFEGISSGINSISSKNLFIKSPYPVLTLSTDPFEFYKLILCNFSAS